MLSARNEEIKRLKIEYEDMHLAFEDMRGAKTTLAKEVHRLRQLTSERSEGMFGDMDCKNGRGDSEFYLRMTRDSWKREIPAFIALPPDSAMGELVDLSPVIVQGDRLEVNGLTIRFEEPIGAGGNGKVIGGTVVKRAVEEEGGVEFVGVKAVMKSGIDELDEEVFREVRALQALGQHGLAPRLVAFIETPIRFLIVMVCTIVLSLLVS